MKICKWKLSHLGLGCLLMSSVVTGNVIAEGFKKNQYVYTASNSVEENSIVRFSKDDNGLL